MPHSFTSPPRSDPRRYLLALVLACEALFLSGCASHAPSSSPRPPGIERERPQVTLQFHDARLDSVVEHLATVTGRPVTCGASLAATRLTLDLREVPWDQAVEVLAAAADAQVTWRHVAGSWRVEIGRTLEGPPFEALATTPQIPASSTSGSAAKLPDPARRIDVDVEDMDLADVMEQIGADVGAHVLVDPNVQENVTVSLRGIPWREAVEVIARMTRSEVEERPGLLLVTQDPWVTINSCSANAWTVAQLMAAYSGRGLLLCPGALEGETTVDLRNRLDGRLMEQALAGLLHANGAELFALHEAWIVAPQGSRPRLAEYRVDLDAQPLAEPPATESGLWARARGVAAHDWVRTLALYGGESVFVGSEIAGSLDREWGPLSPRRELWELAQERGWRLEEQTAFLMLHGSEEGDAPPAAQATRRSLKLPDGRRVVFTLQALVIPARGGRQHPSAILSGRSYCAGDRLLDAEGEELPVELTKIERERVVLRVEGRDEVRYVIPFDDASSPSKREAR